MFFYPLTIMFPTILRCQINTGGMRVIIVEDGLYYNGVKIGG